MNTSSVVGAATPSMRSRSRACTQIVGVSGIDR
jgi:hypothetical protein